MKTKETTPGKTYSVHTTSGCTVSDQNGWSKTIDAPDGYFTAHATEVTIDGDDDATVKELFKLAPAKLRVLGLIGGGALPIGYLAAEFLEFGSKDKYVEITTPWTPAGARVEVRAYERFYETNVGSNSEIGNGSSHNYFFWGAKSDKWHIGCGNYATTSYAADKNWHNMRLVYASTNGGCWVDDLRVYVCDAENGFYANRQILKNFRLGATTPTVNEIYYAAHTQIKTASLRVNGQLWREVHAAIDPSGKPCMYDRIEKETFYNGTTTAELTVGMTLAQARKLGKHLPEGGGTMTVSLPWEAQWDAGVQVALSLAATKGWTITVQYRDPEVATTNIPTSFLETNGSQYVNIPITCGYDAEIEMTANVLPQTFTNTPGLFANEGVSGFSLNKRFSLLFSNSYYNVRADFGDGGDSKHVDGIIDARKVYKLNNEGLHIDGSLVIPVTSSTFVGTTTRFFARNTTRIYARFYNAKIKTNTQKAEFVPVVDVLGVPCLYDKVSKQPFYNSGSSPFIAGFDTVEQARKLATLPVVTSETDVTKKSLTVSLPWEAQLASTGVPAALQVATDRGWTITVQYRDPEVTTENISVDFLESTGGQYIDTGYKPNADFGVYFDVQEVTTPSGNVWYCGAQVSGASLWLDSQERFAIRNGQGGYGAFWLEETKSEKNRVQAVANFYNDRLYGKVGAAQTYNAVPTQDLTFTLFRSHYQRAGNFDPTAALRMFGFKLTTGTELKIDFMPCLDVNGVPGMFNKVDGTISYNKNASSTQFTVGFESTDKAALGLAKLPVVTNGELTVSLPAAAQDDTTLVPAAIEVATQRGWTIITQYRED